MCTSNKGRRREIKIEIKRGRIEIIIKIERERVKKSFSS